MNLAAAMPLLATRMRRMACVPPHFFTHDRYCSSGVMAPIIVVESLRLGTGERRTTRTRFDSELALVVPSLAVVRCVRAPKRFIEELR